MSPKQVRKDAKRDAASRSRSRPGKGAATTVSKETREETPTEEDVSTAIVEAIIAPKDPPLENSGSVTQRRLVVLSFWLIVLLLGLPIWWKTTTVYRANLPLQQMDDWAGGRHCNPTFPINILIEGPELQNEILDHLVKLTQHALDDSNEFPTHHLRLTTQQQGKEVLVEKIQHLGGQILDDEKPALIVQLSPKLESSPPTASLETHTNILKILYHQSAIPPPTASSSTFGAFVAFEIQNLFKEERAILAHMMASSANAPAQALQNISPDQTVSLAQRDTRSVKYAPTYHLSFSLFTPEAYPSEWEIEQALSHTFMPLLHALSPISNFTIDTQVQPYAQFSPSAQQPMWDEPNRRWMLRQGDLGGFINAAEWPLSPNIGVGPTINFILYVPAAKNNPLFISSSETDHATSWLIPQWGGVSIYNGPVANERNPSLVSTDALQPHLITFTSQLVSLLSLPTTPSNSLPLRISSLGRLHAYQLLQSASTTLGSLSRLLRSLPSISIPDAAAKSVASSLSHLEEACAALKNGKFEAALREAREADWEAEKAFFERSMVGQVYFPDEHKVAVYLPLLGPISVPLVLGAVRELLAIIQGWKQRKTKPKTQ